MRSHRGWNLAELRIGLDHRAGQGSRERIDCPAADTDAFARTVPVDGQGSYQGLPGLQFQVGAQPSTTATAFDPWAESSSTLTTPSYAPQPATDAGGTSTATTSAAPAGDAFPMQAPRLLPTTPRG